MLETDGLGKDTMWNESYILSKVVKKRNKEKDSWEETTVESKTDEKSRWENREGSYRGKEIK